MITPHLLIQSSGAYEVRSMLALALVRDYRVTRCAISALSHQEAALEAGAIPIGSVEFVKAALDTLGVKPPPLLSYPDSLKAHLHRQVNCIPLYELDRIQEDVFVKPAAAVKLFDGFIMSRTRADNDVEEAYRQEQKDKLSRLSPAAGIYVSEIVSFQSEWRIYVHKHKIVGKARYDDGDDAAKVPADKTIKEMIRDYKASGQAPVAYSIDVGVLENGKTALVEVNDAWALGLYRDMQDHDAYFGMLKDRWHQITGYVPVNKRSRRKPLESAL